MTETSMTRRSAVKTLAAFPVAVSSLLAAEAGKQPGKKAAPNYVENHLLSHPSWDYCTGEPFILTLQIVWSGRWDTDSIFRYVKYVGCVYDFLNHSDGYGRVLRNEFEFTRGKPETEKGLKAWAHLHWISCCLVAESLQSRDGSPTDKELVASLHRHGLRIRNVCFDLLGSHVAPASRGDGIGNWESQNRQAGFLTDAIQEHLEDMERRLS